MIYMNLETHGSKTMMGGQKSLFFLVFGILPESTVHTRLNGPEPPPRQADFVFCCRKSGAPYLFEKKNRKFDVLGESTKSLEKLGLVKL